MLGPARTDAQLRRARLGKGVLTFGSAPTLRNETGLARTPGSGVRGVPRRRCRPGRVRGEAHGLVRRRARLPRCRVGPTHGSELPDGVRLAPFQVLASEGHSHHRQPHAWHLDLADRLVTADPDGPGLFRLPMRPTDPRADPARLRRTETPAARRTRPEEMAPKPATVRRRRPPTRDEALSGT
jgi:hypothetical protein